MYCLLGCVEFLFSFLGRREKSLEYINQCGFVFQYGSLQLNGVVISFGVELMIFFVLIGE